MLARCNSLNALRGRPRELELVYLVNVAETCVERTSEALRNDNGVLGNDIGVQEAAADL